MKTKFTPGPWDIHGDFREIHELSDEDGIRTIADVDPDNVMPDQRAANARLIAAAPELYEALGGFLREFGDKANNANVKTARAALAKVGL